MVHEVDTVTFDHFLGADTPVLIDFYATWCGPCKMLSPIVDQIADEHSDRLQVGKVDVDANPEIAQKYGIMGMPTLLVFSKGEVVKQLVGYRPKQELLRDLADVLA